MSDLLANMKGYLTSIIKTVLIKFGQVLILQILT